MLRYPAEQPDWSHTHHYGGLCLFGQSVSQEEDAVQLWEVRRRADAVLHEVESGRGESRISIMVGEEKERGATTARRRKRGW